jgi:hypothetical protein
MSGARNDVRLSGGVSKDAGGDRLRSRNVKGARGLSRLAPVFVSVLLLAYAGASRAALGGLPEQFDAEGAAVASTVSSSMSNYVVRDTTLTTGTQVREYIAANGIVFAVTWDGPVLPDLKALLGKYYDAMAAESERMPRAGRSHLGVNLPEVVINSGGHMRAFHGSAWTPAQFPAGFSTGDVR